MVLIAQISDLHLRPRGLTALGRVETNTLARRAVDRLLALPQRPDAVIVSGDVAETGDPREYEMALEILGRLPMPVYAIPGNHDARGEMTAALSAPGYVHATADGSLMFDAEVGPVRLLGLDSLVEGAGHGELGPARLAWLEARLAEAPGRPTLVAIHHPPRTTGLPMDPIGLVDDAAFAAVIARHPQVALVVAGHVHRPIVMGFAGTTCVTAPSVAHQLEVDFAPAAPALYNFEPPGFLIHLWSERGGFATHVMQVERAAGPFDFRVAEGASWPGY